MLALQLKSGEYLTIGKDVVVQVFQMPGAKIRLEIMAPKEVPILRGSVLEREGGVRPEGLLDLKPVQPSRRKRNDEKRLAKQSKDDDAFAALLSALDRIDFGAVSREDLDRLHARLARLSSDNA